MTYRCLICHFDVGLDDANVPDDLTGECICRRCYARMAGEERVPWRIEEEVEQVIAQSAPNWS